MNSLKSQTLYLFAMLGMVTSLDSGLTVSLPIDRKLVDHRSILFAEADNLFSLMNYS